MDSVNPSDLTTDCDWSSNIPRQSTSKRSQAASSIERGQTQNSDSHTISRVDSTASSGLHHTVGKVPVEPTNRTDQSDTAAGQDSKKADDLFSGDDSDNTQTDEIDSSDAWPRKTVLSFGW